MPHRGREPESLPLKDESFLARKGVRGMVVPTFVGISILLEGAFS